MNAREELYAAVMSGGDHSPARSEQASARIDAYRAVVLAEAAAELDRIADWVEAGGGLGSAQMLRDAAGNVRYMAGQDTRESESPRERVFTHRWADADEPHLTILLAFDSQYTDAGIDEITARVSAAARHGYREATPEPAPPAPDFFQPGHAYERTHHGQPIHFLVTHISDSPTGGRQAAFGWRQSPGGEWEPSDSDDLSGWTDTTGAGQ